MVFVVTMTVRAFGDAADPEKPPGTVHVELRDGILTLHISTAPLVEVIRAIGEEAGFETTVYGELDEVLTKSVVAVPLERALGQMLKNVSYGMRFEGAQTSRLTQVLLYGRATSDDSGARATSEPAQPPVIVRALDDERATRIAAIRDRVRAGDPQAMEELTRLLREDADPAVRGKAASALGELGDAGAVVALQVGVRDSQQSVRMRSIRALAAIKNDQSTQVLADLLFNHPDTRTRLLAVWALDQHDTALSRSYLEAATEDGDPLVQQAITRARSAGGDRIEAESETAAP